jgi:hypothetical protein
MIDIDIQKQRERGGETIKNDGNTEIVKENG